MVAEAGTAAAGASSAGQAATTFARTFGKSFVNTAKENLLQQFTGWNQGGMFCRFMKGFGLYGEVKAHYGIWTDDEKSIWEKIQASGMSLILDVFAAKGATTVCFPAGTKVHTQWGLADIEKLEIGVSVLTYNEETGRQEYKQVKKVMRRMTRRMCAMELSNGTTLEVTPEHRFFSNGEWVPIEELNVNDTLQLKDNSIVVIDNKIIFPTFVEVYNLEIEDNENYYVTEGGVLVHNGCREEYVGRTPGKNSRTGREVFDRMLKSDPPTARIKNEFGEAVKEFWDPDNKVWRDISEADMGHIHDAVTYWNETGRYLGAKSKEVRKWMLSSDNYILEYYKTNRSKGAILGQTTTYLPPF